MDLTIKIVSMAKKIIVVLLKTCRVHIIIVVHVFLLYVDGDRTHALNSRSSNLGERSGNQHYDYAEASSEVSAHNYCISFLHKISIIIIVLHNAY